MFGGGGDAAVIMNWNNIPTKLQRELFDCASTIGDLQQISPLKGQIARFLHNHKDDEPASIGGHASGSPLPEARRFSEKASRRAVRIHLCVEWLNLAWRRSRPACRRCPGPSEGARQPFDGQPRAAAAGAV